MLRVCACVAAALAANVDARADVAACPQIRIVVPFTAGGATDLTARVIADPLGAALKKTVVIENRLGATGNIGTAFVAKSLPDGCTLVVNVAAILTYQWIFPSLGYDPATELVPIGGIARSPTVVVTLAANPLKDLKDLVVLSKDRSKGLTYGVAGRGLMTHLAMEELARTSGARFVPVYYKGAPDYMSDLLTARLDFGSSAAGNALPLLKESKLRALAVMQQSRSQLASDIPSSAEQGMSKLDASSHFMLYAPAGIPKATLALLSAELKQIVGNAAFGARLNAVGFDPSPVDADEAAKIVREIGRDWEPTVKSLNLLAR